MKKLLLLSLLVLGAKSFAAISVVGSDEAASLPIRVTGNVVDVANTNILIESTTGGMNGSNMSFTFDSVAKGGTAGQDAVFTIKRGNNSVLASGGMGSGGSGANTLSVGFGSSYALSDTSSSVGTGNVNINYKLSGGLDLENKIYTGTLSVQVDATSATAGDFLDNTKTIYVKVPKA